VAALLVEHVPRDRHQVRPLRLRRVVHRLLLPAVRSSLDWSGRGSPPRLALPALRVLVFWTSAGWGTAVRLA
jgi:hypothetical protein